MLQFSNDLTACNGYVTEFFNAFSKNNTVIINCQISAISTTLSAILFRKENRGHGELGEPNLDVLAGALTGDEDSSALDDQVDVVLLPGQCERVSAAHNLDGLAIDGDRGVVHHLDVRVEGAQGGVVLEQVGGLLHATCSPSFPAQRPHLTAALTP